MAIEKSSAGPNRPTEFCQIIWNKKDPNIPTPNVEFSKKIKEVNPETGTEYEKYHVTYLIQNGERSQPELIGVPLSIGVFRRAGFNDNKNQTGEKNEWHLSIRLTDDVHDKLAPVNLVHAVIKNDTGNVDMNTAKLLNLLDAYVEHVKKGEISLETPIMIALFSTHPKDEVTGKVDMTKKFSQCSLRLPSGYDGNKPLFTDAKNTVKAAEKPPTPEKVIVNDQHLVINGVKAYDHTNTRAWAEEKINNIVSFYESLKPQTEQTEDSGQAQQEGEEEGVDLSEAVDEAESQTTRQRATA